eukprot:COSAG01_NODE_1537_length_9986_cov_28.165672_10_plen_270_part_00
MLLLSATAIRARLDIANPGCHDATIAWLRVQAVSDDPETRRSARHLLRKHGYEVPDDARPPPRRRDPLRPRSPRQDPLRPRSRRREDSVRPSRRLQESGNDGPALRAAFRPVVGTQEEWLQAVGWPTDADANPCDGDRFVWPGCGTNKGCECDNGHVKIVDLDSKTLPGYELQPAVGNLQRLEYLCAPARPSSPFSPQWLNRGRGRYLYGTALSGTLPSDISKLGQLGNLCAPARPSSLSPPGGLTRADAAGICNTRHCPGRCRARSAS